MRVLITGGDGFVGEHLIAELLGQGHQVTASALGLPPQRDTLTAEQSASVEWKVADVLDQESLYRLVAAVEPDVIFHLAAFASGGRARSEPETTLRVNAGGTVNLFEALLAAQRDFPELDPHAIVMGSGTAYGDSAAEGAIGEDTPLKPVSPYGISKACQEVVADGYRRRRGIRTLVARAFNLVGPGQKEDFVVPALARQVAAIRAGRSAPVLEVGNLDVGRDFGDVRDASRALVGLVGLEGPELAYNVCTGVGTTVRRLLEWILDEAGVEAEIRVDPERVRPTEPAWLVGDPTRLRRATGWAPERDLEDAVRETYRWVERTITA